MNTVLKVSRMELAGFALSLFLPSTAVFQKYFGIAGVAAYLVIATLVLLLFTRYQSAFLYLAAKVTEKQTLWLAALTFLIIIAAFIIIYPIANSGTVGGGSDTDDALNIATHELLHGRYPYYPRTYLGNPISPMPGTLFLAIPFVLLGNSAYQNIFWLLVFFLAMKSYLHNGRLALLMLWVILVMSPGVLYQVFTGSDYISNSLYVLLFMLWWVESMSRSEMSIWRKTLAAILFGVGLSSRANFVMILPLVYSILVHVAGWKPAMKYTSTAIIAFMAVTVPFYLYDPRGFTPLQTVNELGLVRSILPYVEVIIPVATAMLAVVLAIFQPVSRNFSVLLRNCMLVLAFPVICMLILFTIKSGKIDFSSAFFGVFFLFFGAVSFWSNLVENHTRKTESLYA
jgi:hypothetical protein